MSLDDFARDCDRACSGFWLRRPEELRRIALGSEWANSSVKSLFARAKEHIVRNQMGRAVNWLATAMLVSESASVVLLKQEGILRASKYEFNPSKPLDVVVPLLEQATPLGLQPDTVAFFRSTRTLLDLARHAQRAFKELMTLARREPFTLAHSCLITIDLVFLREIYPDLDFGIEWSIEPYTKEDIAEGFSFLWSQVYRRLGITRMTVGLWDPPGIHEGRYIGVLMQAAALREFAQAEILVDAFGYRSISTADAVDIIPPSDETEKSIRLGYIDQQMRGARLVMEAKQTDAVTLREGGERLHRMMRANGRIQHIREAPERVRFLFPVLPQLVETLRSDRVFAEEIANVVTVLEDYGLTPENSDSYSVADGLSLGDIRRLQRLAIVTSACVATELAQRRDEPAVVVNSVSPVYQSDDLLDEFLGIVLEPKAAEQFRTLFRWPPTDPNAPAGFDLQYRPLLEAEHEWHLPMAVLASSNLERAALMLTNLRPGAEQDLIEDRIVNAFVDAGHLAASRLKLRDRQRDLAEIDVAALVDDVLLVLECKNSILPCNLFELRTSYQHCETAAGQLDRILGLLNDPAHRETVLTRLGAARRLVTQIVSGIAVSNRLFAGLRIRRHLVIALGQFGRFITHGDFYLADRVARTRGEGRLSGAALAEFMAGGFFRRMFAAMKPAARTYNCGGRNLRFRTFFLDFLELGRQFGIEINPEEFEDDAAEQA